MAFGRLVSYVDLFSVTASIKRYIRKKSAGSDLRHQEAKSWPWIDLAWIIHFSLGLHCILPALGHACVVPSQNWRSTTELVMLFRVEVAFTKSPGEAYIPG